MKQNNLENRSFFAEKFKPILELSDQQVQYLLNLEQDIIKNRTFPKLPYQPLTKPQLLRKLYDILDERQIEKFRLFIKQKIGKEQERLQAYKKERFKSSKNKFNVLQLENTVFSKFHQIILDTQEQAREELKKMNSRRIRLDYHAVRSRLIVKNSAHLLNKKQQELLEEIFDREAADYLRQELDNVKQQYSELKLNDTQAKKILEEETDHPRKDKNGKVISEWDRLKKFSRFIRSILLEDQIKRWEKQYVIKKSKIITSRKDSNENYLKQLTQLSNRKAYYIKNRLPVLCTKRQEIESILSDKTKVIIDQWRNVYSTNLKQKILEAKAHHHYHMRDLCPNGLIKIDLEHQLNSIFPDASFLRTEIGNIDKVPSEIKKRILKLKEETDLVELENRIHEFEIKNFEETGGRYAAWVINRGKNDEVENQYVINFLLLFPDLEDNLAIKLS